jgi:ribosomal protein S18 acetylase RimI-like enzyme
LTSGPSGYSLRPATQADVPALARLVDDAYGHYVERIGMKPGPMTWDYSEIIRDWDVTVAQTGGAIVGLLAVGRTDEGFAIENVAVHPDHQGQGLGRTLLELAESEARHAGFDSIYLFTHEKMTENQALYARIGYVEYDRRTEHGLSRVFMRKPLT